MKQTILSILLLFVALQVSGDNVQTLTTTRGGQLNTMLTDQTVTHLTVSGPLNGSDILLLRRLASTGSLEHLDLSGARIVAGGEAYYEALKTQDDVVGEYMFSNLSKLTWLALPNGVKSIDHAAVYKCPLLDSLTVPDHVTSLGWDALAENSRLKMVRMGRAVNYLGQGVFWKDDALTDVYMYPRTPPQTARYVTTNKPRFHVYETSLSSYQEAWAGRIADSWDCTLVGDLPDEEMQDIETLKEALGKYFANEVCTELRTEIAALSDEELTQRMTESAIPEELISAALKIKNDDWAPYEQQFRIHQYGAYSDANDWHKKLKSYGASYMGNPTGIFANQDDRLYVFVDQDTPADATLYLASVTDNNLINSARAGTKLQRGLNVVTVDANESVFYVLYTANTIGMTRPVSDWPTIGVHIEGGRVNGYYDASHASDAEYQYLLSQSVLPRFTVKGKRGLFNFQKESYRKAWPRTIDRSIAWYDDVVAWEYQLLGVHTDVAEGKCAEDPVALTSGDAWYPTYCNNPFWAMQGVPSDIGWANTTTYRQSYNSYDAVESAFNVERINLDCWCAGHECGHHNQEAINMEYLTEITANIFAYHVQRLTGYECSRGGTVPEVAADLVQKLPFVSRRGENVMRMYYQLYLYYHVAGKNPAFYPTLFQRLRQTPLKLNLTPNKSYLQFVETCCEVAGEDLTDFFTMYGLLDPINRPEHEGEKTSLIINSTQVKNTRTKLAKYERKNPQIMFIEDRIQHEKRTDIFADGTDKVGYQDGSYGDLGQYTEYMTDTPQRADYKYYTQDDHLLMEGTGGVGFAAYAEDGKLLAISNMMEMELPADVDHTQCRLVAIDADGMQHEMTYAGEKEEAEPLVNPAAGQLASVLDINATSARLSGNINGTDILYLRDMIINHNLSRLDISKCSIMAGGKAYYESYTTTRFVVGKYMWANCGRLRKLVLPDNTIRLEQAAVSNCQGLDSLAIPDKVTSLAWDAVSQNANLRAVSVGKGVKNLEQGVFWQCNKLATVWMYPTTPPTCARYIFTSVPRVHVPEASLSAYETAWANRKQNDWDCILVGDLEAATPVLSPESQTSRDAKFLRNHRVIIRHEGTEYNPDGGF